MTAVRVTDADNMAVAVRETAVGDQPLPGLTALGTGWPLRCAGMIPTWMQAVWTGTPTPRREKGGLVFAATPASDAVLVSRCS